MNYDNAKKVLEELLDASSINFIGKETASMVDFKQYYLPSISYFLELGERIDEEKIEEILRGHQGGLELHIATQQGFNKLAHSISDYLKGGKER